MEAARQRSDKPGGLGNRTDALNVHTEVHSIGNKMQTAANRRWNASNQIVEDAKLTGYN